MKKLSLTTTFNAYLLTAFLAIAAGGFSPVWSQCPYFDPAYINNPLGSFSLPGAGSMVVSNNIRCASYQFYDVVSGHTYVWSFCPDYGGQGSFYDLELSLYSNVGALLGYDHSDCVLNSNTPTLTWTATYTGSVRLVVTRFGNCTFNAPSVGTLVWGDCGFNRFISTHGSNTYTATAGVLYDNGGPCLDYNVPCDGNAIISPTLNSCQRIAVTGPYDIPGADHLDFIAGGNVLTSVSGTGTVSTHGLPGLPLTLQLIGTHGGAGTELNWVVENVTVSTSISGTNQICYGASTTLTANPSLTPNIDVPTAQYIWSNGSTASSITVTPLVNTTYTVTISMGNCTASATRTVTVRPQLFASIAGDPYYCQNGVLVGSASGGNVPPPAYIFTWSNGVTGANNTVTNSGTYVLTARDGANCTATASLAVLVGTVSIAPVGTSPCTRTYTALAQGQAPFTYLWSTGETTSTVTLPSSGTYSVTSVDANGCTSTDSQSILIDATPPVITVPANIVRQVGAGCVRSANYTPTATDDCSVTVVSVPPSGSNFGMGVTTVLVTATDALLNSATATFTVTVVDNTPPVMSCTNINTTVSPGTCTRAVTYGNVATDDCGISGVVFNPPAGTLFNLGNRTVTATATDGNGLTSTCTFVVHVVDQTPPLFLNIPSNQQIALPNNCNANIINYLPQVDVVDGCSPSTVTQSPPPGTIVHAGVTTVTFTATDNLGNTSTATFNLDFLDVTPPVITCPANVSINATGNGCEGASADIPIPDVFESCHPFNNCIAMDGIDDYIRTPVLNLNTNNMTLEGWFYPDGPQVTNAGLMMCTGGTTNAGLYLSASQQVMFIWNGNVVATGYDLPSNQWTHLALIVTPSSATLRANGAAYAMNVTNAVEAFDAGLRIGNHNGVVPSAYFKGMVDEVRVWTGVRPPFQIAMYMFHELAGNEQNLRAYYQINEGVNCGNNLAITAVADDAPTGGAENATLFGFGLNAGNCVSNFVNQGHSMQYTLTNDYNGLSNLSGSTFPLGTTTVIWTAQDDDANTSTCAMTVTVNDATGPNLICPGNVTRNVAPGECYKNVNFDATATDDCGSTTISYSQPSGSSFYVGINIVTVTATDSVGNTSTCTFRVTVVETEPPVIACPGAQTLNLAAGCATVLPDYRGLATVTDNCGTPTITQSPAIGSAVSGAGNMTVTLTADDGNGNTSSCSFTVTKFDGTPPVINCPNNISQNTPAGTCVRAVTFTATATDNCGVPTLVYSPASGSNFSAGVTVVTVTATDGSNNTSTCTFTVTIVDNQNPTITCPGNITQAAVAGTCSRVVTFAATAADNCSATISYSPASGSTFNAGVTTVTATATDPSGRTATCAFTVTITEAVPPVITCPATQSLNLAAGCATTLPDYRGLATVTDNCGTPTITQSPAIGSAVSGAGNMTVTLTANDGNGNTASCAFTVTKFDGTPPVITCPNNISQNVTAGTCAKVVTYAATATDNCGTPTVVYSPVSGSSFPVGATPVTVTATDGSNNTSTCSFTVTIVDNINPTITCPGNITQAAVAGTCSRVVTFAATAADNCSATITYSPASGSTFNAGVTTVTATATDPAGRTATCAFTVTITEAVAPVITCPGTQTLNLAAGCATTLPDYRGLATVTDNCGTPTITQSPAIGSAVSGAGNMTVTLTANDGHGNTASCAFTVTKFDGTPPVITCPVNISQNTPAGTCVRAVTFAATATDNCGTPTLVYSPASGSNFSAGVTVVTVTATDGSNNTATCSFTVTIVDNQNPTITCPGNITQAAVAGTCGRVVTFAATAADNCSATISYSPASGSTFNAGVTTVTATATDPAGRTATCAFTVTITEAVAPVITCPGTQTLNLAAGCATTLPDYRGLATVTDNCGTPTITQSPAIGSAVSGTGNMTVTLTANDGNGNTASCAFTVTKFDGTAPTITCPANISQNVVAGTCARTVTYAATATDNCGAATLLYSPVSGSSFSLGTTPVTVTATDVVGNTSTCSFSVTIIDNQVPVIACQNLNPVLDVNGQVAITPNQLVASASDNCTAANNLVYTASRTNFTCADMQANGLFISQYVEGGGSNQAIEIFNGTGTSISLNGYQIRFYLGGNGTPGNTIALNNVSLASGDVYVVASTGADPTLTALADQLYAGSTFSGDDAVVLFNNNNASFVDIMGRIGEDPGAAWIAGVFTTQNKTLRRLPAIKQGVAVNPGAGFPTLGTEWVQFNQDDFTGLGAHTYAPELTVTVTVADASGNTASCASQVRGIDNIAPVITCPANITQAVGNGVCTATVTFAATAIDVCGAPWVTYSQASGTAFPIGNTTITVTARDLSGNSSTCTFMVTVTDNQPPALACQNLTVTVAPLATTTVTAAQLTASATDNCGTPTVAITAGLTSFTCVNAGQTYNVTLTATDAAGNTSTCNAVVTVTNPGNTCNLPPVAVCQNVTVVGLNCQATVAASQFNGGSSDPENGPLTYSVVPTSPYLLGTTNVVLTVTDNVGATATCSATVTVLDNEAPTLTCSSDITVNAPVGQCNATVTVPSPTVTDNCSTLTLGNGLNFDGVDDVALVASTSPINAAQSQRTVEVYFRVNNKNLNTKQVIWEEGGTVNGLNMYVFNGSLYYGIYSITNGWNGVWLSSNAIQSGQWHNAVLVYDGTINTQRLKCYLDGVLVASADGGANLGTSLAAHSGNNAVGAVNVAGVFHDGSYSGANTFFFGGDIDEIRLWVVARTLAQLQATNTVQLVGNEPGLSVYYNFDQGTACGNNTGINFLDDVTATNLNGSLLGFALNGGCTSNWTNGSPALNSEIHLTNSFTGTANASGTYPAGPSTVVWTATDPSGNTATCSQIITVLETQAPTLSCPANITLPATLGQCGSVVTFAATGTDACGAVSLTYVPASGSTFNFGATTVTVTASDASSNTATCTFTVTITDAQVPVIACPSDILVNAAAGQCTATVTFAASATDNCGAATISYSSASGSTFNYGTTTVTATADDGHGNIATCSFTVTVNDTEAPSITCPATVIANAANGQCTAEVVFVATAMDNCGLPTITYSPASGSIFTIGNTVVTAAADDGHGNTATCSFTVTVVDNQPPAIACPANITANTNAVLCVATVSVPVPVVSDNCVGQNLGLSFDGINDMVNAVGASTAMAPGTAMTISGWVYPTNAAPAYPDFDGFFGFRNDNSADFYILQLSNNTVEARFRTDFGSTYTLTGPLVLNTWQHYALAYDGANLMLYVNGIMASSIAASGGFGFGAASDFYVGNLNYFGNNFWFQGIMDDVQAWNVARTPAQIAASMTTPLTGNEAGLKIYYDLNQGTPGGNNVGIASAINRAPGVNGVLNNFALNGASSNFVLGAPSLTAPPSLANSFNGGANASGNYPLGTTNVIWTATDASGNTSTCSQLVTVSDATAPVIYCPGHLFVNVAAGQCSAVATYAGFATDNCGTATISYNPVSGSTFPIGNTVVTATADDGRGNNATCSFTVTVNDTEAPAITCPGNQTQIGIGQVALLDYTQMATATDNCGQPTIVQSPLAGALYANNQNVTVTLTATDASGNMSSCSFDVSVTIGNCGPGSRLYVDDNPSGAGNDGSSWNNAFLRLESALAIATPGTEIWVKEGTYKPTPTNNRAIFYNLTAGVQLYGGFPQVADCNFTLLDRNPDLYVTNLSGDIGTQGLHTDNSYCIMKAINVGGAGTIVDGFVFRDAYSVTNVNTCALVINADGASVPGAQSSPEFANCLFTNNYNDLKGGAVYLRAYYAGVASPTFTHCDFVNNSALGDGGVIFSTPKWTGSEINPYFESCTFSGNSTQSAGGVVYSWVYPLCSSVFTFANCQFNNNLAGGNGGVIENILRNDASSTFNYSNCAFTGNSGLNGSAVYNYNITGISQNVFTRCLFDNNTAGADGTVYSYTSKAGMTNVFDQTAFNNNTAVNGGGTYEYNTSGGPGVNTAYLNCVFNANHASANGGGIYALSRLATPMTIDMSFTTMYGNTAMVRGGAIANINQTGVNSLTITNSIIRGNMDVLSKPFYTNGIGASTSANSVLTDNTVCSNLNSGTGVFSCSTLIDTDPMFVNAPNGDLHLAAGSGAIDMAMYGPMVDLDGLNRPAGIQFDYGAFEYGAVLPRLSQQSEESNAQYSILNAQFNIYPNPSSGKFTIGFPTTVKGRVEVLDMQGRLVLVQDLDGVDFVELNMSGRASGTYLVRSITGGGISVQKLVMRLP